MNKRTLAPHLTTEQLEQRYRQSSDGVARSQWQILWMVNQGLSTPVIIQATGYSKGWIATLVQRYNRQGVDAIGDNRHQNPGAPALLSQEQRTTLADLLTGPAPDGGLWTGPKVAAWMSEQLDRPVHPQRGWELLHQLGFRSYVPRPRHQRADEAAQEAFQKKPS